MKYYLVVKLWLSGWGKKPVFSIIRLLVGETPPPKMCSKFLTLHLHIGAHCLHIAAPREPSRTFSLTLCCLCPAFLAAALTLLTPATGAIASESWPEIIVHGMLPMTGTTLVCFDACDHDILMLILSYSATEHVERSVMSPTTRSGPQSVRPPQCI